MNVRSHSVGNLNVPKSQAPIPPEVYATVLKRRVEARRMLEDEREIASKNRADALDREIAAYEHRLNI
jgi:hypothetical protein